MSNSDDDDDDVPEQASHSSSREIHLDANSCPVQSSSRVSSGWNFFSDPGSIPALNAGETIFAFSCVTGDQLSQLDKSVVSRIVSLSALEDEQVDIYSKEALLYTYAIVKASYLLPGVNVNTFTPELIASVEYQRAAQPGVAESMVDIQATADPLTFRMTKTLISYVYAITMNMEVSLVNEIQLAEFEPLHGRSVERAILLKRSGAEDDDSTKQAKSVLLYSSVPGGVFVTHITVILNTYVPKVAAILLHNLGSMGAQEASDTAHLTRRYLRERTPQVVNDS